MRIFISRELKTESILLKELTAQGHQLVAESLIEFELIPFNYFPPCHWIFFYSQKGVHYFFEMADPLRYTMSKFAVMGNGTAKALIEQGIVPDFIGNGNPIHTAECFEEEAFEQRVLFPQAKNSQKSVEKLLSNQIQIIDLAVYDNTPKKDIDIPFCEILVFTSPINAQAYFSKYELQEGQKIIAIGETTAQAVKNLGFLKYVTASSPSEKSLLIAIKDSL